MIVDAVASNMIVDAVASGSSRAFSLLLLLRLSRP
jgi:hypothetical protein